MTTIEKLLTHGYSSGWNRTPWVIVLHYTAGFSWDQCYNALEKQNFSVHITAERDGTLCRFLDDGNRGWHAGVSQWGGLSEINNHSLGIEIVNFGWATGLLPEKSPHNIYRYKSANYPELLQGDSEWYRDEKFKNGKVRVVTKQKCVKCADHRAAWKNTYWATYPEMQVEATCKQVLDWMKIYKILPENVIGHEHISPGRKSDPGPAFPWRKLSEYINIKAAIEAPDLLNVDFNRQSRIKAVQSHCARLRLPVGEIDGWWGKHTEESVKMALAKYSIVYSLFDIDVDPDNVTEIANSLRLIPGF